VASTSGSMAWAATIAAVRIAVGLPALQCFSSHSVKRTFQTETALKGLCRPRRRPVASLFADPRRMPFFYPRPRAGLSAAGKARIMAAPHTVTIGAAITLLAAGLALAAGPSATVSVTVVPASTTPISGNCNPNNPPPGAVAAGFTTLAFCEDFSLSKYATLSNWLDPTGNSAGQFEQTCIDNPGNICGSGGVYQDTDPATGNTCRATNGDKLIELDHHKAVIETGTGALRPYRRRPVAVGEVALAWELADGLAPTAPRPG
jgi:hypothetical protein